MRVILIILDSVGIGEMPDAPLYGDTGSNTLANIARSVNGLRMPNMQKLGLGNIYPIQGVFPVQASLGAYGKLKEHNNGKDTTTGHWEMCGIYLEKPFDFFPNGFDSHIINEFERRTNRKVIGNTVASGTKIIQDLGPEQEKTGSWIVYTSADSVFQVAAHEEIIPLEELYHGCKIAHEMFKEMGYNIGRIIARPYVGRYPEYIRTSNRKDISSPPPAETVLDVLTGSGIKVYAVGKIHDIFAERGISEYVKTVDNTDGVEKTLLYMKEKNENCFIFTNLVDFDMKYGHRNDVQGYADALMKWDEELISIMSQMKNDDILMISADHGCDPTTPSTDHSREYIPFMAYGKPIKENVNIGTRESFADIGQTIADIFGKKIKNGQSFKNLILK